MYSSRLLSSIITITEEDAFVVFEYIKTHNRILFVLFTNSDNFISFLIQGTSADQDNRFTDKKKKLMKQMRFAESIESKVHTCSYINEK